MMSAAKWLFALIWLWVMKLFLGFARGEGWGESWLQIEPVFTEDKYCRKMNWWWWRLMWWRWWWRWWWR